jgi:hypothetical protein
MLNQEQIDLIENHLNGVLTNSEQQTFDQLLSENAAFAKTLEENKLAHLAIQRLGLLDMASKLDNIHSKTTETKRRNKWLTGGAALLLTTICGTVYYTNQTDTATPQNSIELTSTEADVDEVIEEENVRTEESAVAAPLEPSSEGSSIELTDVNNGLAKAIVMEETVIEETETTENTDVENVSIVERTEVEPKDIPSTTTTERTVDCSTLKIDRLHFTETCAGEETASIDLDNIIISGGAKPYDTKLFTGDETDETLSADFLAEGNYIVKVTDINSCTVSKSISILSKTCAKQVSASFSPAYGEVWTFPEIGGVDTYELEIIDISGNIIFSAKKEALSDWDGKNISGETQAVGVYFVKGTFGSDLVLSGTVSVTQ